MILWLISLSCLGHHRGGPSYDRCPVYPGSALLLDEVRMDGMLISVYETTQGDWSNRTASNPTPVSAGCGETKPVMGVDLDSAFNFANTVSSAYNLPHYYRKGRKGWTVDVDSSGFRYPTGDEWWRFTFAYSVPDMADSANICDFGNVSDQSRLSEGGVDSLYRRYDGDVRSLYAPCSDGVSGLAEVGSFTPTSSLVADSVGNADELIVEVVDGMPTPYTIGGAYWSRGDWSSVTSPKAFSASANRAGLRLIRRSD